MRNLNRESEIRFPSDRSKWSFGLTLSWHLFHWGTRPGGSPKSRGALWDKAEFAGAAAADNVRNVENWLRDQNVPRSLKKLEEVLFGDGPDYDDWRAQFRRVYEKQKSLTTERAIGEARNFIFPPEMPIWNFGFVGREDELAHLNEILSRDDRTAITEVAGARRMGGVGKTALAVEYFCRFGSRYGGVWWCRSETRPGLLASLGNLLRHLEPQAPEEPDLATAARAALPSLANRNASWLLGYDNVPSPDEINDLMPHAGAK